MSTTSINLSLFLGPMAVAPAPAFIAEALQSVEITQSDEGPSVFQIGFHADRNPGLTRDYSLLSSDLLRPTNRVVLTVAVNGTPRVLMDGFITNQELTYSGETSAATLTVTGEDVSVLMDLYEYPLEYPAMGDALIAAAILAKYTMLGIDPVIVPTPTSLAYLPVETVQQQTGTDRAYLKQIAAQHGYVFYVQPGPEMGTNTVYWGPPLRYWLPQKALSVNVGPASNVESFSVRYDALAPNLVHGLVQDTETEEDVPVVTLVSTRTPPLASEPAITANFPFVRNTQYTDPRLGAVWAYAEAQAITDQSADKVVVVQGQLDTLRYGDVLTAPGLIGVRGMGYSYDGLYYVQSVTHTINRRTYKQSFTLNREGVGSLTPEVVP